MVQNSYVIPIIGPLEKKKSQTTVPLVQTIPTVENISTTKDSKPSTVVGFPQRSDPSGNRTLDTTSGDVIWGSLKESLGNALSGIGTLLQSTQGENLLREETIKQEQAQKKYDKMLADNRKNPGTWDQAVLDSKAKELESNQRLLDAGEKGIADSPILQGVNQVRDFGADLALSGAQDIARAKENTNGFGRFMVDVGAAGTQFLGDAALGALTSGVVVLPMNALQALGAGANQAKAAGANLDQQLAYGLGTAALNLGTEKLFNLATPLKKTYGSGFLDFPLANTGRADAMKRLLSSAATEGGEEFLESMGQTALQRITYDPDAQWDFSDALYQAGVGATLGGIAGGIDPFLAGFEGDDYGMPHLSTRPDSEVSLNKSPFLVGFEDGKLLSAADLAEFENGLATDFISSPAQSLEAKYLQALEQRKQPVEKPSFELPAVMERPASLSKASLDSAHENISLFLSGEKSFDDVLEDYTKIYADTVFSNKKCNWLIKFQFCSAFYGRNVVNI